MSKFVFPFVKKRFSDGSYYCEPKIPVIFSGPAGQFPTTALIDTGSTISHIPLELAEFLGFEGKKAKTSRTTGIGGNEEMGEFKVGLKFLHKNQSATMRDVEVLVFLNPERTFCLLGLYPLFEKFDIAFRMKEGKIELKEK